MFNGKGVCFYANGDYYTGSFLNRGYDGYGVYYYAAGDKYEGGFAHNQFDGEGTYTAADGTVSKFKYENGKVMEELPYKAAKEVTVADAKPVKETVKCVACNGTGKVYRAEVKKTRTITKDISNGLGPRNFITYPVSELIRPAGYVSCGVCKGKGVVNK